MSVTRRLKTLVSYFVRCLKKPAATEINELLRRTFASYYGSRDQEECESGVFPIRKQKMVLLSFPVANRDLEMFLAVHKIAPGRQEKHRGALGRWIYLRAGSNQTLVELQSAIREWFGPIPKHRVDGETDWPDGARYESQTLPIVFG